jgi:hypothetical protein
MVLKASKLTDDMKIDLKYYGCGSVTNQIKEKNGSKKEMHAYEDRSLCYE